MRSLLIIGAGGFADEVEEMARLLGYSDIAFLDDNPDRARCSPVVGSLDDIVIMKNRYPEAVVALGNNEGCHILLGAVVRNEVTLPEKTWVGANQVAE